jgi:hypothetical protein
LVYIKNCGPGAIQIKPKDGPIKQLAPGHALVDDARQEVTIDVIDGEEANILIQAQSGGTVGLSETEIPYFKRMWQRKGGCG